MMIRSFFPFAPACLLALTMPLSAQDRSASPANGAASGHSVAVPSALAARLSAAISLDGRLDDAAWQAATPVTEFTQVDPSEGQPASERT
jgi:hypothetical protein